MLHFGQNYTCAESQEWWRKFHQVHTWLWFHKLGLGQISPLSKFSWIVIPPSLGLKMYIFLLDDCPKPSSPNPSHASGLGNVRWGKSSSNYPTFTQQSCQLITFFTIFRLNARSKNLLEHVMEERGLDIRASTLGRKARYGLFATSAFRKDEIIDVLTGNFVGFTRACNWGVFLLQKCLSLLYVSALHLPGVFVFATSPQLQDANDPIWRGCRDRVMSVSPDHQPLRYPDDMPDQHRPKMYMVGSQLCPATYANTNAAKFQNARLVDTIPPIYNLDKGYQSMQVIFFFFGICICRAFK
jgi:hypothetical protein